MYDDPMNPFNPFGYMPEMPTPKEDDEKENIHLLGCLHVAVGFAAIFVLNFIVVLS